MGVLLVHGLPGDPEGRGDLLPRPAAGPGVADLQHLEAVGQLAQRPDGAQAGVRVVGRGVPTRVYVPYGADWFRYCMRRLAESQGA